MTRGGTRRGAAVRTLMRRRAARAAGKEHPASSTRVARGRDRNPYLHRLQLLGTGGFGDGGADSTAQSSTGTTSGSSTGTTRRPRLRRRRGLQPERRRRPRLRRRRGLQPERRQRPRPRRRRGLQLERRRRPRPRRRRGLQPERRSDATTGTTSGTTTGDSGASCQGVALIPTTTGYIAPGSNSVGIHGSWFIYSDCTGAGCATVTSPTGTGAFPNVGGKICTSGMTGTAASYAGGAGVGMELNDGPPKCLTTPSRMA